MNDLPEPLDGKIMIEEVKPKLVAVHRFSWRSSPKKNNKKVKDLKDWSGKSQQYEFNNEYTYAGYNPPWTIPFLRRNEVLV